MKDTIAIVGGGFSGSLTAFHLVQEGVDARVIVIDPAPRLGLGLAYSTPSSRHLLNVPAGKISALPKKPNHFVEWLKAHSDEAFSAEDFVPRAVFGKYVQSLLARTRGIEHVRSTAVGCRVVGEKAILRLEHGEELAADAVVLATGNFPSATLPGVSERARAAGTYSDLPWEASTYAKLTPDATVALIGSGLTAVDVLLRLRELGHCGPVKMVSRTGVLPRRHERYQRLSRPAIEKKHPKRASELLALVHSAIRSGSPWRAVIDSLREVTNELWLSLPLHEQKRFRRHLQRRWDVVRHRMAPGVADCIATELAAGSLQVIAGRVLAIDGDESGATVTIRAAHGSEGKNERMLDQRLPAARVINCTGPNMNYTQLGSPLLDSLFSQGLISAGPHGSGLWSNREGALRKEDGLFSNILFNIGPGRQGVLLESIAVPELREQAADLAQVLRCRLSDLREERIA